MNRQFFLSFAFLAIYFLTLSTVPQYPLNRLAPLNSPTTNTPPNATPPRTNADDNISSMHHVYHPNSTSSTSSVPFTHIISGTPVVCHSSSDAPSCALFFAHVRLRLPLFIRDIGICGGSVISRRLVLTAAHCTKHVVTSALIKVSIGATTFSDGHEIGVSRMYVHPLWVFKPYDIALFLLDSPIPLSLYRPVRLGRPQDNHPAVVYGLGFVKGSGFLFSRLADRLNAAVVRTRDEHWCRYRGTRNHETCATGIGPCLTDSGGPLMIPPRLYSGGGKKSEGNKRDDVVFDDDEQPIVVGVTVRITKGGCEHSGIVSFYSTPYDFRDMIGQAVGGNFSRWSEARPSLFGDREAMRLFLEKADGEGVVMKNEDVEMGNAVVSYDFGHHKYLYAIERSYNNDV